MVKKEVFEWIRTGQKNIEFRRGKTKKGAVIVFQCGRNVSKVRRSVTLSKEILEWIEEKIRQKN